MDEQKVYIKCSIKEGLFSTESVVTISAVDGEMSFVIDENLIRDNNQVEAQLVRESGDESVVLMPTGSMENGYPWASVSKSQLISA